jgi:hypothetical protein
MTLVSQTLNTSGVGSSGAIHLLLTEGDVKLMAANPESVMEEIQARATLVSSVLKEILQEPHVEQWELNG